LHSVTKRIYPIIIVVYLITVLFWACKPEEELTTSPVNLVFSVDTVSFDTVFSQLDSLHIRPISVTKQLRVSNPNKNAVKTNIRIINNGNTGNIFRLNIDGVPTNQIYGKQIDGEDSLIIFIQCYIDANERQNINDTFGIFSQLVFETNGNTQEVNLIAWGQNGKYFKNEVLDCSIGTLHWTPEKPYILYDSILIPEGCTLTIDAGTRIYSYNKSSILVAGTLIVNGTPENPVIFQGTRIDAEYNDLNNQWAGIRFLPRSKDNSITGAIIKNGFVGIEVDSLPVNNNPNLTISQSQIFNMAAAGIVGYSSKIVAVNNLITECGQFGFLGALGGDYKLVHNTIASYNLRSNRQNPIVVFDNSPYTDKDKNIIAKFPLEMELVNNIVYGSLEEEFLINNNSSGLPITPPLIQTNLIRTKQTSTLNTNGNILNQDPLFENYNTYNFQLKSTSPAKNTGTQTNISIDIKNNTRSTSPSIGCWE